MKKNKLFIILAITLILTLSCLFYLLVFREPQALDGGKLDNSTVEVQTKDPNSFWKNFNLSNTIEEVTEAFGFDSKDDADNKTATVTRWRPASLFLDTYRGQEKITINPLDPMVILRINNLGDPIQETLVTNSSSQYWKYAFCEGDHLELEWEGDKITEVRNLGPRDCQ